MSPWHEISQHTFQGLEYPGQDYSGWRGSLKMGGTRDPEPLEDSHYCSSFHILDGSNSFASLKCVGFVFSLWLVFLCPGQSASHLHLVPQGLWLLLWVQDPQDFVYFHSKTAVCLPIPQPLHPSILLPHPTPVLYLSLYQWSFLSKCCFIFLAKWVSFPGQIRRHTWQWPRVVQSPTVLSWIRKL